MTRLNATLTATLAALALALTGCSKDAGETAVATAPAADTVPARPPTPIPAPPALAARSYIVIDHDSGRVLAALEPDARQEPASLTKVMTAYGVFHALQEGRIKLDDMVTISEHAWKQEGSRMFIEVGKQVSVENLILGMIVQSGNDATVALAEHVAGTEPAFVQMMNAYAKELGMTGSNFTNSAGMSDPEHYTTARDSAVLSSALIREFPEYYRWYSQREFSWNGITQQNRNGLLWREPSVDGVKTGHTETAGYCLIASAKRDANMALINYGFNFFETKRLYAAGEPLTTARVWKGKSPEVGLALKRDLFVTGQRGHVGSVKAEFELPERLIAPLSTQVPIGKASIVVDGATIATHDLYPAADVPAGGIFRRTIDTVRLWFN
jgi:D-alanyl-D-alanine carboxypeptidase (penicillin-binding protein 5/6)